MTKVLSLFVGLALLGLLYVRFAPSDPDQWHLDIAAPSFRPDARWAAFCKGPGTRFFLPSEELATLDAVAMATPRTTRLAGSVDEGRITWVTRSRLAGFPDYTTAAIREMDGASVVCVVARQRFGLSDLGVDARRLGDWLQRVGGLNEPPDLGWR